MKIQNGIEEGPADEKKEEEEEKEEVIITYCPPMI